MMLGIERRDFVLPLLTVMAGLPLWIAGVWMTWEIKTPYVGYAIAVAFLASIRLTVFMGLCEIGWIIYLVLGAGTLFDLKERMRRGMQYSRLLPHVGALGFIALTYGLRNLLHLEELLNGLAQL